MAKLSWCKVAEKDIKKARKIILQAYYTEKKLFLFLEGKVRRIKIFFIFSCCPIKLPANVPD